MDGNNHRQNSHDSDDHASDEPIEIALVGDLTDNEAELTDRLLGIAPGGECTFYIDSPGGSPYCALSLMTIMRLRNIQATAIVTGECSSAALWPFAACTRRLVTPYSVLLFHPMKWQSEEHVGLAEAAEWSRHFGQLEKDMDTLLCDLFKIDPKIIDKWINPGRYISGRELAEVGLAELLDLNQLANFQNTTGANGAATNGAVKAEKNGAASDTTKKSKKIVTKA